MAWRLTNREHRFVFDLVDDCVSTVAVPGEPRMDEDQLEDILTKLVGDKTLNLPERNFITELIEFWGKDIYKIYDIDPPEVSDLLKKLRDGHAQR